MTIRTYVEACGDLKSVLDEANDDRVPVLITRPTGGNVVVVAESEWNSIAETLHLLGSRANAERLFRSMDDLDAGHTVPYDQDHREAAE